VGSFVLTLLLTFEWIRGIAMQEEAARNGLNKMKIGSSRRHVDRFFDALKTTLEADGQPDVEALLEVELAVFKRISHSVEVIGNLLITLGLIGTVMGLTLTLTGLTSSLEALGHDQELLLSGLRKAMGGMGTAFYTTLLGAVLGGVLLRVFAQITEHGVEGLFDMVMRICLVHCSADYKPSLQRDMRFLNTELMSLDKNARSIEQSLALSRDVMNRFHEEVLRFNREAENKESDSIEEAINRHMRYVEVLRREYNLLNDINASWWQRLKSLFGLRR
jgi:hypothetical protein